MGCFGEFRTIWLAFSFTITLAISFQHGALALEQRLVTSGATVKQSQRKQVEGSETRIDRPVNRLPCQSRAMGQRSQSPVGPFFIGSTRCPDGGAQSTEYFSSRLASPQEHFDMWLKLKLYPPLCHTVLCRRQCALNGYESCNALGVKRSILQGAVQGPGGCDSGGCNSGDSAGCKIEP